MENSFTRDVKEPYLVSISVQQPLEIIHKQFTQSILCHYMADILLADSNSDTLRKTLFKEV